MQKSTLMQNIEVRRGESIQEIIRRHVEQGKSQEEIAADLGVSLSTLRIWMYRLGAEVRSTVYFRADEAVAT